MPSARTRLSGSLDIEAYQFTQPSPALLFADDRLLFSPRLTIDLDADLGRRFYAFVRTRVDRGFDPSEGRARVRLDEAALRFFAKRDGSLHLQAGKFATVVGSWVPRHDSWSNPFVSAPLPYENLTGIWDVAAVRTSKQLLAWSHVPPAPVIRAEQEEKPLRVPVIWGPVYAMGGSVGGAVGRMEFALEWKRAPLSADPEVWDDLPDRLRDGSLGGRIGFRPNEAWAFGVSAAEGPYLRESAVGSLPAGSRRGDYLERVVSVDAAFAWHRFQVWSEVFRASFGIPGIGRAKTITGYLEAKYKFGLRWSLAARLNGQEFSRFPDDEGGRVPWGRRTWRVDLAPSVRFTAHAQLKFQQSVTHESGGSREWIPMTATQLTIRF